MFKLKLTSVFSILIFKSTSLRTSLFFNVTLYLYGTRRNAYTVTLRTPIYSTHTIDWHGITRGFGGGSYGVQHHFNNISAISCRSDLLVEEKSEIHRPVASHWQTLSYSVVSSTPRPELDSLNNCWQLYVNNYVLMHKKWLY